MTDEGIRILSAYRSLERIVTDRCPMCERVRQIVLDITVGEGAARFATWSICDECAPRATHLLGWLGEHLA